MPTSRRRTPRTRRPAAAPALAKCPRPASHGLDEITGGGLPRAARRWFAAARLRQDALRPRVPDQRRSNTASRACSWPSRKPSEDLSRTSRSLGYDLDELIARKKLAIDYVRVERAEIEETGEYDLEGLFIRLTTPSSSIGAKRLVLDTDRVAVRAG